MKVCEPRDVEVARARSGRQRLRPEQEDASTKKSEKTRAQRDKGEGQERGGVDEEGGAALVPREGDEAESEGGGDHPEAGWMAFDPRHGCSPT